MAFEDNVIRFLKEVYVAPSNVYSMEIKYLVLNLLTGKYDASVLSEKAREEDVNHRLGYLCDVVASAAESSRLGAAPRLYELARRLYTPPVRWQYLDPALPEFAKRILDGSVQTALNEKWHVRTALKPEEIVDWLELYPVQNVTASRRTNIGKKGHAKRAQGIGLQA